VVVVRISDVLQRKGPDVTTLDASATVRDLVEVLAERSIGAVIVSADGRSPAGMVSERDVVRRLQSSAEGLLEQTLASIMTADVVVCGPQDQVDSVLQLMTERRIRHVPVIEDAQVVGLVSIGDLVKSRIDELRLERDQLSNYISGSA
jgi:CBS domain-containing protein